MAREKGMHQYILFGNGKTKCYLEHCCPNTVEEQGAYCNQHMTRFHPKYAHSKLCQWNFSFKHGSIKDPYNEASQLYGSPWYEKWYRVYGAPNADDLKIAQEHQEAVRQIAETMPQIKITDYMPASSTASVPSTPRSTTGPKTKRRVAAKKKDDADSTHSSSISSNSILYRPVFSARGPIRFYESTDAPLEVTDVVYIDRL
jgi:hypothetical protein